MLYKFFLAVIIKKKRFFISFVKVKYIVTASLITPYCESTDILFFTQKQFPEFINNKLLS